VPAGPDEPAVTARLRAAGCVFAEEEARLLVSSAATPADLDDMVSRRAAGLPLEHILGWAEFCGLRIGLEAGVFVPRRRTEFLVREAARLTRTGALVVDLCCGSGALGAAVHAAQPGIELYAADIDPVATACARRNLAGVGQVFLGDLFAPLPGGLRGRVDVLIANVPYVPTDEVRLLPAEARDHEARGALDGGPDGLDVLRRVAAGAPDWLAPGGHLLSETGDPQAADALAIMAGNGLSGRVARSLDLWATVVVGTRPACSSPSAALHPA